MVKTTKYFKEDSFTTSEAKKKRSKSLSNEKMPVQERQKPKRPTRFAGILANTRSMLADSKSAAPEAMTPHDAMRKILSSLEKDLKVMLQEESLSREGSSLKTLYDELFMINLFNHPFIPRQASSVTDGPSVTSLHGGVISGNFQSKLPDYFTRASSSVTMITEEEKEIEESKFASNDESTDSDFENETPSLHRSARHSSQFAASKMIQKKGKLNKLKLKEPASRGSKINAKTPFTTKVKEKDITCLIEKISGLAVSEDSPSMMDVDPPYETSLVFFLRETFEEHFDAFAKDLKKSFFSPLDLKKIEIFTTNHQRLMMARVSHTLKDFTGLAKSKSPHFTTDLGGELYSRSLKGTFRVFADICQVSKVKELINY
jgi:hypothetical protein